VPLATLSPPAVSSGPAPSSARLAAVLLHGRDRTSGEMIALAQAIALPDVAWLALEAPDGSWYPGRFMEPLEANQAHFDRALDRIDREVRALEALGLPRSRIALVGFSQGACVACEYVRRHPGRWGALIAFTGGLPGPQGHTWTDGPGLDGTPVLLSNGDHDDWVPWSRVEETAAVFRAMGADVTLRLYPGRDHLVSDDEIREAKTILEAGAA
jgi:phospholipase/carboxylesterase